LFAILLIVAASLKVPQLEVVVEVSISGACRSATVPTLEKVVVVVAYRFTVTVFALVVKGSRHSRKATPAAPLAP
jgi:hypothetical protein